VATPSVRPVSPPTPSSGPMLVTPEMAQAWLQRNTRNRYLRPRLIDKYARDMAAGRWMLNGESIKFDTDGNVLDGQNRLHAIVKSGVSVHTFVAVGLDGVSQRTMDSGSARTAADNLVMDGIPNAASLAAAARLAIAWLNGKLKHAEQANHGLDISTGEIMDFCSEYPEFPAAVNTAMSWKSTGLRTGPLGFTFWATRDIDKAQAVEFFTSMAELRTDGPGDPRLALLRRLQSAKENKETLSSVTQCYFVFRAWNAYRSDQRLAHLPSASRAGSNRWSDPK
jgi:hypothetical protein